MDSICNDWKHVIRNETSQKSFLETFCYNYQGARKIKSFLIGSDEKICLILQSNNTKYIKTFKFISWLIFMEKYHNLGPDNWGKIFTDWFTKCSDDCIRFYLK